MSGRVFARERLLRWTLAVVSVLATLAAFEVGLRLTKRRAAGQPVPRGHVCGDCAYLYELNTAYPGISPQGLRDRAFSPAPPEGTLRILVLGDSVAYGNMVPVEATFPKLLEKELGERWGKVEVLNAGVPGYSPYNELQAYTHALRSFHPRVVLVSFCMNDVVDPSLHLMRLLPASRIPDAAIPNPQRHRELALPELARLERRRESARRRLLLRSELYRRLDAYVEALRPRPHLTAGGKRFPTYLADEDTVGMEVLARDDSVEWGWLRSVYDELGAAVRADGAAMGIIIHPVSYQLAPDYPLDPGPAFARYCDERRVPCFDLLPTLREHRGEQLFPPAGGEVVDIWHYTPAGHRVAAHALADMILAAGLLPER